MRCLLFLVLLIGVLDNLGRTRADEKAIPLASLPAAVTNVVKSKFPTAEPVEAVEETEDGEIRYEVVLKVAGKQVDVTVSPEGEIELIEKELAVGDLPKVVTETMKANYPKVEYEKIEAVYEIEAGREVLEYYELTIKTESDESIEVRIDQDGEIQEDESESEDVWTSDFSAEKEHLTSIGRNPFFVLVPGHRMQFQGGDEILVITVLNETKIVDGVETRVVEERESKAGKLVEVSRNYFAISKVTNSVYYFGEDVDMYQDGVVVNHEGAWLSGVDGAKFGLAMPGLALIGAAYQQETAPGVAMDRAEIVAVGRTVKVPAGEFTHCVAIEESTPLEPNHFEQKMYAPHVGLLVDGSMKLVSYGPVASAK